MHSRNQSLKDDNNNDNIIIDEKPIKLIDFQDSKFVFNQEAQEFLKSINEELVIVSIVGKARTGKSYLLNLLLDINKDLKGVKKKNK